MPEVHRYQVVTMLSMAGATIGYDPHGPDVVMASDFDNAIRLFLDAAERCIASERREKELQQRLTAADERVDMLEAENKRLDLMVSQADYNYDADRMQFKARTDLLEGLLRTSLLAMKRIYQAGYDRIIESGGTCDTPEYMMEHDPTARDIRAALKPAEEPRNQCDGCQAGIPLINGAHRMGREGGYPDLLGCTAKLYKPAQGGGDERSAGCCCPPKGHTGLWAAAMCPVHQGLRALKR